MKGILAPSILSADFSNLMSDIKEVEELGVTWLHVDVMDGHFVPNMTIGPVVVESLRKKTNLTLDCHLMVKDPHKFVPWFLKAGADFITYHFEATSNHEEIISTIRTAGKKVGVSIKPGTEIEKIFDLLPKIDLVLVMSVEPGFGGQSFMPDSLKKVKKLSQIKKQNNYHFLIEIDGGINDLTAQAARLAGVEVFVAGSSIFHSKDRREAVKKLHEAIK